MSKDKGYVFNIQKFCIHDGEGIRTTVFLNGCNLNCKWCANPESRLCISDPRSDAVEYSVQEILKEVLKDKPFYDKSGGGVTLSGGETLVQKEFALALIEELKKHGVSVTIETAGNVCNDEFRAFVSKVDFVFIDCKHYDEERHVLGTGASNKRILENISWLAQSGKPYMVRIPVIPNFNDGIEDANAFGDLFLSLGVKEVELLPFHQLGQSKYKTKNINYEYENVPQKKKEDLKEFASVLEQKGISVSIGG